MVSYKDEIAVQGEILSPQFAGSLLWAKFIVKELACKKLQLKMVYLISTGDPLNIMAKWWTL